MFVLPVEIDALHSSAAAKCAEPSKKRKEAVISPGMSRSDAKLVSSENSWRRLTHATSTQSAPLPEKHGSERVCVHVCMCVGVCVSLCVRVQCVRVCVSVC
jgi:hypothetical protein